MNLSDVQVALLAEMKKQNQIIHQEGLMDGNNVVLNLAIEKANHINKAVIEIAILINLGTTQI